MSFSFKLRGKTHSAPSIAEASALYCKLRDESGEGASTFPMPALRGPQGHFGKLAYNGKVYCEGRDGSRVLVFDPYTIQIVVLPNQTFRGVLHFEEAKYDVSTELAKQAVASGVARLA